MSGIVSYDLLLSKLGGTTSGFTAEGGVYVTLINDTGAASVKGTIVASSTALDDAVSLTAADSLKPIGIIYEDGIANGANVKVVINGKAEVLLKNGEAATRGYWCSVSDVAGRMHQVEEAPTTLIKYSRAIGQSLQSKAAGTNVLSFIIVHFN